MLFRSMVSDLTGLPLAGASLLDEATAAAEAMTMAAAISGHRKHGFFASEDCHPQTLALLQTRADGLGIELHIGNLDEIDFAAGEGGLCGLLVQYPTTDGRIENYRQIAANAKEHGCLVVAAADLLSLTLLTPRMVSLIPSTLALLLPPERQFHSSKLPLLHHHQQLHRGPNPGLRH